MSRYNTVEEYADHIGTVTAKQLAALCRNLGPMHPATIAIEGLCTEAANIMQQGRMRQEQAGSTTGAYDLAALGVDASVPSDSETGYEDRG